ncbi:BMP family ABC transporter substrate-binding protein [Bdellovibrio sp. qaytius]|nr:BMP family ABC transporter substrate-binding protein [Bdellovibrio sp. qaytius]
MSKFLLVFCLLMFQTAFAEFALANTPALKIGLVLDKGGKDDKSFNSAAYAGAKQAEKELGIELKYVEATDNNSLETLHRNFAQKKYDLVIGIGFAQTDAIKKVSALFPETKFAIVDGEVTAKNVRSLLFEEHEGSYLVGAAAAMKSKTGVVGFIGGMDIPLIRRFQKGFEAGVKSVNPKATVLVSYIGVTGEAWNNPAKAKEIALSQISQKADVIFHAAGASGSGLFDAASDKKIFAIGVDSNQNWVKPGVVLTSMLKKVDVAVFETIKSVKAGSFQSGVNRFGLKDGGIDWALDENNKKLWSAAEIEKLNQVKKSIITGKVTVPDYYKTK